MLHATRREADVQVLFNRLVAVGEGAPTPEERLALVRRIRASSPDAGARLDRVLLDEVVRLRAGLGDAQDRHRTLEGVLDQLTAPPWHPAILLDAAPTDRGAMAMVLHGSSRRVVRLADGIDAASLRAGDEVLLGPELNVIVRKSPYKALQSGDTATFDRRTPDGRVVLKWRDEELLADVAGALRDVELKAGDVVRWSRDAWIAFDRVERGTSSQLFLEDTPRETFADIAGLDDQIAALQRSIRLHLFHAETAGKYRLRRKGSVLLAGPPGTGKTMLARAMANWLAQIAPSGRAHFMNVKPGSLNSVWYSQSESNHREAFKVAREAGFDQPDVPVVMFFDEIDSIGAARGASWMRVDDRVLTAFMTELDGLEARGNILVIGSTNRPDALDPALVRPGRMGDLIVDVPRPRMQAGRQILARHLAADIPYAAGSLTSSAARDVMIDAAVSRIYSPNGEGDVAVLTFRDGKTRAVQPRDLVNGAMLANMARTAVERACAREIETGEIGVRLADLLSAVTEELERTAGILTPANCGHHISDLPADVPVARVDRTRKIVAQPWRYLSLD